jgi:4-hydroxybenzoate polyprenyltransferase
MRTPDTMTFPKAMLITMRPYLLFLSGITGIAGIAAVPGAPTTIVLLVSVASFLSYGFGQALTDCFQTDTDAISAPYRPLAQGAVSRKSILIASLAGLTLCSAIFTIGNPANLFLGAVAVVGLATYTWFKRRWWGGPWYNAWIVAVLCIMAYLAGTGTGVEAPPSSLVPLLALVFFGYANFVLSGYFKDIAADRQTGYNTFPVVYGRGAAAFASDVLAAGATTALAVILLTSWTGTSSVESVAGSAGFALLGAFYAVRGQLLLHRNTRDGDAHKPIRHVIQSYVLYLAAAAVTFQPSWTLPLVLFYVAFLAVLAHRTERSQI